MSRITPLVKLTLAPAFTALVCVATMSFTVYVPLTRGFFNIGETMIYITALLFGPAVAAFAGGVGSALADVILGYSYYAPATLVIKAVEGYIVGALARKRPEFASPLRWKAFTLALGLCVGAITAVVGAQYYSGLMELQFGQPFAKYPALVIYIPSTLWIALGLLVTLIIALMGLHFEPQFGWLLLAIIAGGLEMVLGYFLYEQFFLGVAALVEVPVNIGQMTVGLLVAVPLVRALWRAMPSLRYMAELE